VLGYVLLFATIGASIPAMFGNILAYLLAPSLALIRLHVRSNG
jgi:hypothetical protein